MLDASGASAMGAALEQHPTVAVILATGTGHIGFWNQGATAMFGHAAADVTGRRVDLIVPPAYREAHWAGFNRTIGSRWRGADAWGQIEALHKSGAIVAAEVLLTPIAGADGRVISVLGMFRRPI